MNKGTIVYIGGFELPDKNAAAHRVINNGKALRDVGYNVIFLGVHKDESEEVLRYQASGFEVFSVPYPKSKLEWLAQIVSKSLYLNITEDIKEIDSIILYNFPAVSMLRLYSYFKSRRIKVISDCTEWYSPKISEGFLRWMVKSIDVFLRMKVANLKVDLVISISIYIHDYYISRGQKSILIPPLVDIKEDKWDIQIRSKDGSSNPISFFYAGSPFTLKDVGSKSSSKDCLDVIVDAFYNFKVANKNKGFQFRFDVFGLSYDDFLRMYPGTEIKLDFMCDDIFFHGMKSHRSIIESLKKSNFMIFYRDQNLVSEAGFPTKFVEAIAAGVPVITNKNSDLKNYILNGKDGFLVGEGKFSSLCEVFSEIFSMSCHDFSEMKATSMTRRDRFDYRKFLDKFQILMVE